MDNKVIRDKQDLTYLKWSHIRSSSGTAGTFLKSQSSVNGIKRYYKLSNFDPLRGIVGHECVNEIIVDRLLSVLGIEHLNYELIYADIEIEGNIYSTYLCTSEDFKQRGESKTALDNYYRVSALRGESHYDFCMRQGWGSYADIMLAIDYIIMNRDRHGANIEVLRNARAHTVRLAPLFDHGLSLLYSCSTNEEVRDFDVMKDLPCQSFLGGNSCYDNLKLIRDKRNPISGKLNLTDREKIFYRLEGVLSDVFLDKIWDMIYNRYMIYEELFDN